MKFLSMLFMYVQSGTNSHFHWRIVAALSHTVLMFVDITCAPKLYRKHIETWVFIAVSEKWPLGKISGVNFIWPLNTFSINVLNSELLAISYSLFVAVDGPELNDHDDVIKWKHFPRYLPFVSGIHPTVTCGFPHKGQWRGALICG